jgi:hypothetical protein
LGVIRTLVDGFEWPRRKRATRAAFLLNSRLNKRVWIPFEDGREVLGWIKVVATVSDDHKVVTHLTYTTDGDDLWVATVSPYKMIEMYEQ